MTVRIACLWVPDVPLQALRRTAPELAEAPLAVAAGPLPRDAVVAVAAEAAALGVGVGMTAAQARQRAPRVLVRVVPPPVMDAAVGAMRDVAAAFSPRVGRGRVGEMFLDIGGLLPRFGNEERLAHELLRAARRAGFEARVGIAGNPGVARLAARCAHLRLPLPPPRSPQGDTGAAAAGAFLAGSAPDVGIVRPEDEARFVAPLPVVLLDPSPSAAERLASWGIRRAGELAALPRDEIALRLGGEGVRLHRLACGEADEEFIPEPMPESLAESVALEFPLGDLEGFLFVLRGLLGRLADRLRWRGEGFAELLLDLWLEGGGRAETKVRLVAPSREVDAVLPLVRLQLEARPPGAPVEGVTALVTPGRVRLAQGSLFGPALPAPGKLARTLARLAALVGPQRVGAAAVPDTHRPGAWSVVPFEPAGEEASGGRGKGRMTGDGPQTAAAGFQAPVLRAFRPPREARVVAAGTRPVVVQVDRLGGTVVGWAGPYRFLGEWWTDEPFARDDFDVATADGALLRIHFDRLQRRWFADGVYD